MAHNIFACGHEPTGWGHCPVCGSTEIAVRCTCGSGGHPRYCDTHPDAYAAHVAELEAEASDAP
jgi:hypothetical protein